MSRLDVEYSWEWGAFPQPSPMKASFGMGGRAEGGRNETAANFAATWGRSSRNMIKRINELDMNQIDDLRVMPEEDEADEPTAGTSGSGARSRSVPPALEGSPARSRRKARTEIYGDVDVEGGSEFVEPPEMLGYGAGGRLSASESDPTRFTVSIEGRKVGFELSIVSPDSASDGEESDVRGRRDRDGASGGTRVFDRRDEVEAARLFEKGQIDLYRFFEDKTVVSDPRLVIRWAGGQFVLSDSSGERYSMLLGTLHGAMTRHSWTRSCCGATPL